MSLLDTVAKLQELEGRQRNEVDQLNYLMLLDDAAPALLQVLSQFRPGDADALENLMHDIERNPAYGLLYGGILRRLQEACRLMEG